MLTGWDVGYQSCSGDHHVKETWHSDQFLELCAAFWWREEHFATHYVPFCATTATTNRHSTLTRSRFWDFDHSEPLKLRKPGLLLFCKMTALMRHTTLYAADDRYWHFSDMPGRSDDVRYSG